MNDVSIFAAAVEKADPAERTAYLDEVCRDDVVLRGRVESLLAAHDRAGDFLERPAVNATQMQPDRLADTRTYDSEQGDVEEEARALLEPSTKPGSLGRIGQYEVLEVLGRGGFGIVYRAFDDVLQRVVAVKVLAPRMATTSPARKRFLREARSSAGVRHENVVQVYAVVEQPFPYLVMEYIPGETLQQRIDRTGPLELRDVLSIGRQIAEGLAAAHATGLVHRDIKPANVLIENGPQASVKLTDFGLARAADDASMSQSGVVAGTPMYMAPEQARGDALDHRADLFSLGSVLYMMCTGRPPFRANSTLAVLKRVADEQPRPIREIIPEVPDWFCRIVEKLHEKESVKRFQTAREVADVLADCERQLVSHDQLTDLSRIPAVKATVSSWTNRRVRTFGGIVGVLAAAYVALWFYPFAARYLAYRSTVEIIPASGLTSVIVWRDGQAITDWFDANSRPTISLPPGRYKLEPGFAAGRTVERWELTSRSIFTSRTEWQGVHAPEFEVRRGDQVMVRAVMRDNPATLPATAPPSSENGWLQLFNGKDLTGWKQLPGDRGKWTVTNGILEGRWNKPTFLFTVRNDYQDFHLRVEMRVNEESGIGFRCPEALYFFGAYPLGYNMFLKVNSEIPTGKMYSYPAEKELAQSAKGLADQDKWFTLEVIARGDRLVAFVNGKVAAEATDAEHKRGSIVLTGLEDTEYRKIEIKEFLPSTTSSNEGFASMFNGKDLTGWTEHLHGGSWRVAEDGTLTGTGTGHLSSKRDYKNFHLKADVRISEGGDSGLMFRCDRKYIANKIPVGFEAMINPTNQQTPRTGSLMDPNYGYEYGKDPVVPPDTWFTYEVIALGEKITLKVNGQTTLEGKYGDPKWPTGPVGLQLPGVGKTVSFRKIEIKELPADSPASATPKP